MISHSFGFVVVSYYYYPLVSLLQSKTSYSRHAFAMHVHKIFAKYYVRRENEIYFSMEQAHKARARAQTASLVSIRLCSFRLVTCTRHTRTWAGRISARHKWSLLFSFHQSIIFHFVFTRSLHPNSLIRWGFLYSVFFSRRAKICAVVVVFVADIDGGQNRWHSCARHAFRVSATLSPVCYISFESEFGF